MYAWHGHQFVERSDALQIVEIDYLNATRLVELRLFDPVKLFSKFTAWMRSLNVDRDQPATIQNKISFLEE